MIEWRPIEGFPKYVVSSTGLVANIKDYLPLSQSKSVKNHTTYCRATLFLNGERHYKQVHRLVAQAFCDNPENLLEVDHKDNNGENNHYKNLQWVTRAQNIQQAFIRNPAMKRKICSDGGLVGGRVLQAKAEEKYQLLLKGRFRKFFIGGELCEHAAVRYVCECGTQRTANIMSKELRVHKGKCPVCTNTVNRSSPSLE